MTITLDDVACLWHLPVRGILLYHMRIRREEVVDMMVTHLGVDLTEVAKKAHDIRGAHVRFNILEILYKKHL